MAKVGHDVGMTAIPPPIHHLFQADPSRCEVGVVRVGHPPPRLRRTSRRVRRRSQGSVGNRKVFWTLTWRIHRCDKFMSVRNKVHSEAVYRACAGASHNPALVTQCHADVLTLYSSQKRYSTPLFSNSARREKREFLPRLTENKRVNPGGAGGNRTHEYRFCRPVPYHLATAPTNVCCPTQIRQLLVTHCTINCRI